MSKWEKKIENSPYAIPLIRPRKRVQPQLSETSNSFESKGNVRLTAPSKVSLSPNECSNEKPSRNLLKILLQPNELYDLNSRYGENSCKLEFNDNHGINDGVLTQSSEANNEGYDSDFINNDDDETVSLSDATPFDDAHVWSIIHTVRR